MKRLIFFLMCIGLYVLSGCVKKVVVKGVEPVNCFDQCKKDYDWCQKFAEKSKEKCISQGLSKPKCESSCIDEKSNCIDSKAYCQDKCL